MSKTKYRWHCVWTNGHGCFHPDYEACGKVGGWCNTLKSAVDRGLKHNQVYERAWYGYTHHSTYIEQKTPSGRISPVRLDKVLATIG